MPKDEIDFSEVTATIKEVNTAFSEFKQKHTAFEVETKKGFEDVVRKEEVDRINTAIEAGQTKLDEVTARLKRLAQQAEEGPSNGLDQKAHSWAVGAAALRKKEFEGEFKHSDATEYKKAFDAFMRQDERQLSGEQVKALSVGRDPDGGYLVEPNTNGRIVDRIYETSPVRQYANVMTIGTDALEGLFDTDEAGVGWVGETGARSATTTPQLDKWRIAVHEMYAKPAITQKLLDDSSIDVQSWLAGKVADKMGRFESSSFVTGDGVDQPRGFLTYDDFTTAGTYQLNAIEQFDSGVNGGFAAAPEGGDILLDALYGLKTQYRANATWFMNRATTKAVRKLKDSDGAYLWQPGIQANQPASLLGYGVAAFEDMPDLGTGSLSIAVGDMGAAYQIVDRMGIRVLVDPYSNKPYVEYYTTRRVGGAVVDFDALKIINFKA